ncbi:MAG: flavohemoprotein [Methylotenera sp.]|nr:flavohemoprotein [Methylotenera sp.]
MLSEASRPYITASVPVLREHGLAITTAFYRNMFIEFPEFKNLFNMGNQAQGLQQQSLASAVFAYAANIDNTEVLAPVISRIVHKHVSLGIVAEHYPIVGRHLLGAIKEILGDAATEPLIDAWAEAYGLLADALIATEKALYNQAELVPGSLTKFKVVNIKQESELVKSFELLPLNGEMLPTFKPGQYISVAVDFDDGSRQFRQYSLSDSPSKSYYRISVKREPAGVITPKGQVSNWLHQNILVGDTLQASHPFGDFNPEVEPDETILMVSGGIGITPMIATLNHLAETNPEQNVIFLHAANCKSQHSHVQDIEQALTVMPNLTVTTFYKDILVEDTNHGAVHQGELQIKNLKLLDVTKTKAFICGPDVFMKKVWVDLLDIGITERNLYREVFGPDLLGNLTK